MEGAKQERKDGSKAKTAARKKQGARYTVSKGTALAVVRAMRAAGKDVRKAKHVELVAPDPGAAGRWSRKSIDLSAFGLPSAVSIETPVQVAVPSAASRLRVSGVESAVHAGRLPRRAVIDAGSGISCASPELLFVELATEMTLFEHLLLGMELCGTYALDAADPDGGLVSYGVKPATTVADLASFVTECGGVHGVLAARRTLKYLAENAWSPMESLIAALVALPLREGGYDLGAVALNPRIEGGSSTKAESRVPDIMFSGSNVGLNYDGEAHFGLAELEKATVQVAADPGASAPARYLERLIDQARASVVADKRRDRDLAAQGMLVLPVTKEDVLEPGGLDFVMLQCMDLLERDRKRDMSLQRRLLRFAFARKLRQHLIWANVAGPRREEARAWLDRLNEPSWLDSGEAEYYLVNGFGTSEVRFVKVPDGQGESLTRALEVKYAEARAAKAAKANSAQITQ